MSWRPPLELLPKTDDTATWTPVDGGFDEQLKKLGLMRLCLEKLSGAQL
jgi:hypothetical protein